MRTSIAAITFDCRDAGALAAFWSEALSRPVDTDESQAGEFFASIGRTDQTLGMPALMFIQVPEDKSVKNRVHLDLDTDDREATVARLLESGASHVHDRDEWGVNWTTLLDPEGNEFCVAQH
ncbi:MAG: VOC family protein [Ilumatobacter sp.]|uniref:VOC family protein n=1 Tax=Ilumatobacter sp. TaxID=1967498 RepID=UPI003C71BE5C